MHIYTVQVHAETACPLSRFYIDRENAYHATHAKVPLSTRIPSSTIRSFVPASSLVVVALGNVQTKTLGVEVDLVVALLENGGDVAGVLELPQVDVAAALLDGITDELGRTCLTLSAHDGGLLLLSGLVDNESGALGFLLCDLLGFNSGSELGREGEVLEGYKSVIARADTEQQQDLQLMRHHQA